MNRVRWLLLFLAIPLRAGAENPDVGAVIQTVELNAARACFVPTHPRVTTTIRFPGEISAPDGSVTVFAEDASKQTGEYLITWEPGDAYFTITPMKDAGMANLNVPYQGRTYVFYFYPAGEPLKAVAAINLVPAARNAAVGPNAGAASGAAPTVTRQSCPPKDEQVAATPARLLGLLDRLKLIHATPIGPGLAALVQAMQVEVAAARGPPTSGGDESSAATGLVGAIPSPLNDAGLYEVLLLRVVRDSRMNCLGFICLLRNTSDQVLTFDVNSFGVRAGSEYLAQRISDATPILRPGEQAPAYFIVAANPNNPLAATNGWKISVDLVSPRPNPGAALAGKFRPPPANR